MSRPHGPQRRFGERDGLPEVGEEERLVHQQGDHIAPEAPVPARLGQPQRLVEVALGEPVRVGVVRADVYHGHQSARGAMELTPHRIAVAAAQQRGRLGVEEADDARTRRDSARPAIHQFVVGTGGTQGCYVGRADPLRAGTGHVGVLRRVLPLPDGHHRGGPRHGRSGDQMGALLFVGAPQSGGPLHESGER